MTPTQIERNREFLKDLRTNPWKAKEQMRDDNGGRCCLCVALDTALRLGYRPANHEHLEDCENYPPHSMGAFFGWPSRDPCLSGTCAVRHNDGDTVQEKTHKEIADLFEREFPEIKEGAPNA